MTKSIEDEIPHQHQNLTDYSPTGTGADRSSQAFVAIDGPVAAASRIWTHDIDNEASNIESHPESDHANHRRSLISSEWQTIILLSCIPQSSSHSTTGRHNARPACQNLGHPLGGATIPKRRTAGSGSVTVEDPLDFERDPFRPGTNDTVRTLVNGRRPLGRVP